MANLQTASWNTWLGNSIKFEQNIVWWEMQKDDNHDDEDVWNFNNYTSNDLTTSGINTDICTNNQ